MSHWTLGHWGIGRRVVAQALVVVLFALGVLAAQMPRGSLSGRVVDAETGTPVAGARVSISMSDAGRSAVTDADGRFTVPNLGVGGRYRFSVSAPGFLTTGIGYEPLLGNSFLFFGGSDMPPLEVPLHRGATIAGRVVDHLGEPATNVQVRAFRLSGAAVPQLMDTSARRMGVAVSADPTAQTDGQGQFRIIAVEPGAYVVGAVDRTRVTLSPAASVVAEATAVTVRMGEERSGIDIRLRRAASGAVTGVVMPPPDATAGVSNLWVRLENETGLPGASPSVRLEADGRFRFDGVSVGRYTLEVDPGGLRDLQAWGHESIAIAAGSTLEQNIRLRPGARVAGELTGGHTSPRVQLAGLDGRGTVTAAAGPTFALAVPPGRYRWAGSQALLGTGPRVLRAYVGGEEVTDVPLVVTETTRIENAQLVVEDAATITGSVRDGDGRPISSGAIIMASADPRHWTEASSRVRLVRADQRGVFEQRALPAGNYRVAHVTTLSTSHIWERVFLSMLRGTEVSVGAGEVVTVEVRVR